MENTAVWVEGAKTRKEEREMLAWTPQTGGSVGGPRKWRDRASGVRRGRRFITFAFCVDVCPVTDFKSIGGLVYD